MRTILALALLIIVSAGLQAQVAHRSPPRVSAVPVAGTEAQPRDTLPMPAPGSALQEQTEAIQEADTKRGAPIFDREFVRHVAAMVIAAVLTAIILRAIF